MSRRDGAHLAADRARRGCGYRARLDRVGLWQRSYKAIVHDPPSEPLTGMTHSIQEEQHDLVMEAGVPAEEVAVRDLLYQGLTWWFGEEVVRA